MTKEQQLEVLRLRGIGLSFGEIADKIGLSKNTVKSFYRRKHDTQEYKPKAACEQCGAPIFPKAGHKVPRFCSDKCRSTWWNAHPGQMKAGGMIDITCKGCGTTFRAYPSQHREYCSRACSSKAHSLHPQTEKKPRTPDNSENAATASVAILSLVQAPETTPITEPNSTSKFLPVISKRGKSINDNQTNFITSMGIFRKMLSDGLLSKIEYDELDSKMKQKYGIPLHSVFDILK